MPAHSGGILIDVNSLTHWVLAHKRTVVVAWVVLTIAGIMAAGPATDALKGEFSIPGKESWKTNVEIAQRYHSDRNGSSPLIPVITLPMGQSVSSPQVRAQLERLDARLRAALSGTAAARRAFAAASRGHRRRGRLTPFG